jgi:aspartate/methionine/tyrosine aminotransferase
LRWILGTFELAKTQGLLLLPGEFFGASQGKYLRVAFANASADQWLTTKQWL